MAKDWYPLERLAKRIGSRHAALLFALLVLLATYPFLHDYHGARWIIALATLAVLVASTTAIAGERSRRAVAWLLGIPAVAAGALSRSLGIGAADPVAFCSLTLFFGFLIVVIFADVMRRQDVTMDTVLGACNVYILLGMAWGSLYALLEWSVPSSFAGPAGQAVNEFDLVYFSLIDLTTIGFGDVVPVSPQARGLAAVEGLVGQLYLAIIIGRLVGLEVANRINRDADVAG